MSVAVERQAEALPAFVGEVSKPKSQSRPMHYSFGFTRLDCCLSPSGRLRAMSRTSDIRSGSPEDCRKTRSTLRLLRQEERHERLSSAWRTGPIIASHLCSRRKLCFLSPSVR